MTAGSPSMRLAISMRRVRDPKHGEIRDALSTDWSDYIRRVLPHAILLPAVNAPEGVESWASALDPAGLILTNGNDWGEDTERDASETELVSWFRARRRPILGVCRGFQALNVLLGGKIEPSLEDSTGKNHAGRCHDVELVSEKHRGIAQADTLVVNSFHDQGVTRAGLAHSLLPIALAEGSIVEGFEHENEPIAAIQWHPERPGGPDEFNKKFIEQFFEIRS